MDVRSIVRALIARYRSARYRGEEGPFVRFEARDVQRGLDVLINVLTKAFGDSPRHQESLDKLRRAMQGLDHPRIARVLEVAQEQGLPYVVQAVIRDAKTLAERLTTEPLDLEKAGAWIAKIGSALEYAGQQDMPHGALTPDRIFLDEREEITLTGFGLAMLATLAGVGEADVLNPYVAPEQRLEGSAPTTRSDVYSLAAILYRLITGRDPDPDPTRIVRADLVNRAIPPAVSKVVARALSPEPAERYQSADDFVLAVRSAIRSPRALESVSVQPAGAVSAAPLPEIPPFPEPLEMPQPDMSSLDEASQWAQEVLKAASGTIRIPEPLPMPEIHWDEWLDANSIAQGQILI